jgi:hypothetical protein
MSTENLCTQDISITLLERVGNSNQVRFLANMYHLETANNIVLTFLKLRLPKLAKGAIAPKDYKSVGR